MANKDELVALSGVSRSTVYRFLKGSSVRPEARELILSAMQQLNMPYDHISKAHNSRLVISIRPDFQYFKGYGLSVLGFTNRAESLGYTVQLQTDDWPLIEKFPPVKDRCAGVLILGKSIEDEEAEIDVLSKAGIPFVFVNRILEDPSISWVSIDIETAAKEAVLYLLDKGHKQVGTWGATSHYRIDCYKRRGYLSALNERGIPVGECCLDDNVHGGLEKAVQDLIDNQKLPTAWFAASDECAMRFAKVIRENGLKIPNDVALVGMDDVEPAAYMNPALTSIHIPYQDAGAEAAEVLNRLIENPGAISHRVVLGHRLVVRESC